MHETVIAQQVVRAVVAEMDERGASACKAIDIDLGQLEALSPRELQAAFDLEASDTPADGAVLRVSVVPATGVCPSCKAAKPFELPSGRDHTLPRAVCPDCGAALELRGGRGFVIRRATLVLEDP
ncbi:MAG TPA: hydrogenase maturation nickel metallochaperone HypA [Thermoplasmata archaeon]|nr:hydrogenase maturation nickel metallochaperone HypA [Thermoplasmata archaeon]